MAIAIKSIPTLKTKAAKSFIKKAKNNASMRGTVKFSEELKSANVILQKAAKNR